MPASALVAMMVLFFHAARLALVVFDPYMSSRPLAEALLRAPPGKLIVDDQYYTFSSVFFYTNRTALLLNGRVNNLEYGSYAPDAPQDVFIDDPDLPALWAQRPAILPGGGRAAGAAVGETGGEAGYDSGVGWKISVFEPVDVMSFQIGDTVGDYQVTGVLGRGGMGRVFRVRHTISQREEAMKIVLPDFEARPDVAERFLREIRVHASLTHPNIAAMHTAFRVGPQLLMVMELVEGTSVEELLRNGPIGLDRAIAYTDQVLAALAFAHERGVIHRDIKPANIMVTVDGTVKLMDFGIARAAGQRELTGTGVALGSLYYMSPEQVAGHPVDARSDLYAAGITLYEMATGRRPIQGGSEYSIMQAHLQQAPAPPSVISPEIPPSISNAILKALEKQPAARFQTAEEFRRALSGTISTTAASMSTASLSPEILEAARQKLAVYIGPIAKVLVERTARRVQAEPQFYQALAEHVPPEQRRAFLASLKR